MHILAQLIKSPLWRWVLLANLWLFLIFARMYQQHQLQILTADNAELTQEITELRQVATRYARNQQQLAILSQKLQQLNQHTLQQSYQLEQLKNDNQALRDWANTRLPADVIRLYSPSAPRAPCLPGHVPAAHGLPNTAQCLD